MDKRLPVRAARTKIKKEKECIGLRAAVREGLLFLGNCLLRKQSPKKATSSPVRPGQQNDHCYQTHYYRGHSHCS